jgi:hypothetical protein
MVLQVAAIDGCTVSLIVTGAFNGPDAAARPTVKMTPSSNQAPGTTRNTP